VQDVTSPYARSYWKLRNSLSIAQNLYRYHHRDLHIFAPLGSSIKASRISPCSIVKPLHSENGLDSSYCPKPCPATHPRFPSPLPVSEITQIHTAESHSFHVSHPHIVPTNPASLSLAQKKSGMSSLNHVVRQEHVLFPWCQWSPMSAANRMKSHVVHLQPLRP